MNQQNSDRENRLNGQGEAQHVPNFKPVALPALAAAVQVTRPQPSRRKNQELPAILRKDAGLG